MKKLLWIAGITGIMLGLLGIQTASKQEILNKETKTQTIIDSLQNVIDSLRFEIDTIQYESIDTTILRYPWGREEIYYFKYKEDE